MLKFLQTAKILEFQNFGKMHNGVQKSAKKKSILLTKRKFHFLITFQIDLQSVSNLTVKRIFKIHFKNLKI